MSERPAGPLRHEAGEPAVGPDRDHPSEHPVGPLRHDVRVRYAECDQQGVVFNAHYLAWFDVNMTELWRAAFGSYQTAVERGIDIVVAAAELTFRAAARFEEVVTLEVSVAHLGTTSIITRHAVTRSGEVLVQGSLRHVTVDPRTLTKTSMPAWVRDGLSAWALPGDAPVGLDIPGDPVRDGTPVSRDPVGEVGGDGRADGPPEGYSG